MKAFSCSLIILTLFLFHCVAFAEQPSSAKSPIEDWGLKIEVKNPHNIVDSKETFIADLSFENPFSEPQQVQCYWNLKSLDGTTHAGGRLSQTISSPTATMSIESPSLERNFYWFNARAVMNGSTQELSLPIAVIDKARKQPHSDPFFCMNSHEHNKDDEILPMAWANVGSVRLHYSWGEQERAGGEHIFSPRVLSWRDELKAQGIEFFPILAYGNPLYTNDDRALVTEQQLNGYARYCREQVRQWGGPEGVRYWEVWNEPNVETFWHGTPEQYLDLLKIAYEAIKEEDPEAVVVGLSTAGVPLEWIERQLQLGALEYCDSVSIHPYQYPDPPETYLHENLRQCRELLNIYGGEDHPLFITEIGWPTHSGERGVSLQQEASYLVRSYVETYFMSIAKKFFWYDFRNDGNEPSYNEHNFGIMFNDLTPKPAYPAFAFMSRMLEGALVGDSLFGEQALRAYSFVSEGRFITVVWNWKEDSLLQITGQEFEVLSMFGTPLEQREIIKVSPEPLYIISPEPLQFDRVFEFEDGQTLSANIWNSVRFKLKLDGGPYHVRLLSGEGLEVRPSSVEVSPEEDKTVELQVRYTGQDRMVQSHLEIDINGEKYRLKKIWEIIEPLRMNSRIGERGRKAFCRLESFSPEKMKVSLQIRTDHGTFETRKVFSMKPGSSRSVSFPLPPEVIGEKFFEIVAVVRTESDKVFSVSENMKNLTMLWLDTPPDVNWNLEEWPESSSFILREQYWTELRYPYGGYSDISARCWIGYDLDNFYLAVEVFDDVHYQRDEEPEKWKGDSIQFAFSRLHRHPDLSLDETCEFTLSSGVLGPEWTCSRGELAPGCSEDIEFSAIRESPFLNYEMSIPWKCLGVVDPEPTRVFGFSLIINDNDGRGREGWLHWADGIGWRKNPDEYGDIWMRPEPENPEKLPEKEGNID